MDDDRTHQDLHERVALVTGGTSGIGAGDGPRARGPQSRRGVGDTCSPWTAHRHVIGGGLLYCRNQRFSSMHIG
jgi:hypothetical protein